MVQQDAGKSGNNQEKMLMRIFLKRSFRIGISGLFIIFLISCNVHQEPLISTEIPNSSITEPIASVTPPILLPDSQEFLTKDQITTLSSLQKIDDYPLYTMIFEGALPGFDHNFDFNVSDHNFPTDLFSKPDWACSLFAALGDDQEFKFGRNFDWEYSPGLLLFTNPADGYASVSMVDIAYLGFEAQQIGHLQELELAELTPILDAPNWPFDGMNEAGLAIGMAAVPSGQMNPDPEKSSIGSLEVMRRILDGAANVREAVSIMESHNIDFRGGPDLHYLIADQSGAAVLVEFFEGEMLIIPNADSWHLATNFLTRSMENSQGQCSRYDKIYDTMLETGGNLSPLFARELLSSVSQNNTQWSVVYNLHSGTIQVTMDRQFDKTHEYQLIP